MSELKPCPFCNIPPASRTSKIDGKEYYSCLDADCPNGSWFIADEWNTRPIEDALQARIAELEAVLLSALNALVDFTRGAACW